MQRRGIECPQDRADRRAVTGGQALHRIQPFVLRAMDAIEMPGENLSKQIFLARPVSAQIREAGPRFLGNGTDSRTVVA